MKINAGIVHEGDVIKMWLADGTTQSEQAGRTRAWACPPLTYKVTVNGILVVDLDPSDVIDVNHAADAPKPKKRLK